MYCKCFYRVDKDMVASIFFVSLIVNMIATIMQLIYNKAD